jgi:hypothetical protein
VKCVCLMVRFKIKKSRKGSILTLSGIGIVPGEDPDQITSQIAPLSSGTDDDLDNTNFAWKLSYNP